MINLIKQLFCKHPTWHLSGGNRNNNMGIYVTEVRFCATCGKRIVNK